MWLFQGTVNQGHGSSGDNVRGPPSATCRSYGCFTFVTWLYDGSAEIGLGVTLLGQGGFSGLLRLPHEAVSILASKVVLWNHLSLGEAEGQRIKCFFAWPDADI